MLLDVNLNILNMVFFNIPYIHDELEGTMKKKVENP
jgi:hypothetical protein